MIRFDAEALNVAVDSQRRVIVNHTDRWSQYSGYQGRITGYDMMYGSGSSQIKLQVLLDLQDGPVTRWFWQEDLDWCIEPENDQPQPETTGMSYVNYSITAFLLNPKCRAVKVSYDKDAKGEPLDIKLCKTVDETVAKGDLVIIPTETRYGFTVCKVVETDVDWEPDTQEQVRWIVGKVSTRDFEDLKAADEELIHLAKESEKTDKRKKLQEKMFAHIDAAQLNGLSISRLGGNTNVIEHNPVADETKSS